MQPDHDMPEENELLDRLRGSESMRSLLLEMSVAEQLRNLGWEADQSCYYLDLKHDKYREVDVVGRQIWERDGGLDKHRVRLKIVVECKSARSYHLLLPRKEKPEFRTRLPYQWLGIESDTQGDLWDRLNTLGLTREQAVEVLKKFKRYAYPNEFMSLGDLRIDPPDSPNHASAFRETNIGGEKELDNSVLWRSNLSLRSAVASLLADTQDVDLAWIESAVHTAQATGSDIVSDVVEWCARQADFLDLYHPVLVIDSRLWSVEAGNLAEIPWCRFEQLTAKGPTDWWVDVVNSSAFDVYLRDLTEHYSGHLKNAGAELKSWDSDAS